MSVEGVNITARGMTLTTVGGTGRGFAHLRSTDDLTSSAFAFRCPFDDTW